jgi:hypothetical protein
MKRLRLARSMSSVRRGRAKYLAAVATLLVALGAFAVPSASARHHPSPAKGEIEASEQLAATSGVTVPLRRGALESCMGAVGGTPVPGSTATINATIIPSQVTATVNLHGLANTFYFIQLVTSGCQTLGFSFTTTNGAGNATVAVTAARGTLNDAFVTAVGGGDFQVSAEGTF